MSGRPPPAPAPGPEGGTAISGNFPGDAAIPELTPLCETNEGEEIGNPLTSFFATDAPDPPPLPPPPPPPMRDDGGPSALIIDSFFMADFFPKPEKKPRLEEKLETLCIEGEGFIPPSPPAVDERLADEAEFEA